MDAILAVRRTIDRATLLLGVSGLVAIGGLYTVAPQPSVMSSQNLVIALAIFVAALTSSIAGFAFSAICGALLFHLLDAPAQVVHIMLMCSIANQSLAVWSLRRTISWPAITPYLIAGLLGAPVGVWLLLNSRPHVYLPVFGALMIAYSLYAMLRPAMTLSRPNCIGDWFAGFLGGLASGFAAIPGAPVSIWCSLKGQDKLRQRAVYQPFILVMQIVTLLIMHALHPRLFAGTGFDATTLMYLPISVCGTWLGLGVFKRLNDRQFALAVNLLLIISGLAMVV